MLTLGKEALLTACRVMVLSGVLVTFINLTPGSVVLQEAVFVAIALAAAILDRGVGLGWAMGARSVLMIVFARRLSPVLLEQALAIQSDARDG